MTSTAPFETLLLTSGEARLVLVPEAGGAIAGWRVGGQAMLFESAVVAGPEWNPLQMASFPLVPFSNRIGGGAFSWGSFDYHLPPSVLPDRHAIHGVGWRREWRVAEAGTAAALLRHDHSGDEDWPWAYRAEQAFRLAPGGLEMVMRVTNCADAHTPLAIGIHPYFHAAGAHLQFSASQIWQPGVDHLPDRAEAPRADQDFRAGLAVASTNLDHGYDGWDGSAAIWWDDRPMALRIASDLPCAVVHTPPAAEFFCFEPVPHSINALNLDGRGKAMPVVAPGESLSAHVRFDVVPREAVP